ncbi:MAG: hypothetical protein IKR72_04110 [Bacteroidales bacterium]|nr:hypothetical protein [Bacteroidales bacterium]
MNPRTRIIPIALAVLSTLGTISCSKGPAGKIMIGARTAPSLQPLMRIFRLLSPLPTE